MIRKSALLFAPLALAACGGNDAAGGGRDQIRVVGSSTVYPFTTAVAEQFASKTAGSKAPVVESTGTGAGMKLFCSGVGAQHPDIEDASRRMKKSEFEDCRKNGVTDIVELQIGIDGLALIEANNGPKMALTTADIYKALAATPFGKPQTAKTWKDVNPSLPAIEIKVFGPPSTSGTRDSLAELILDKGCDSDPAMAALKKSDEDKHKTICTKVREDGVFVESGENDNLIVQKLQSNPNAIGVFGYSYLEENKDDVNGVSISGVAPTYATIADNAYPGSRPLYIYVKKAHLTAIPGLRNLLKLYAANWGATGPLVKRGLIASPAGVQARSAAIIANETVLDPAVLS